jgi:hypothetical protein
MHLTTIVRENLKFSIIFVDILDGENKQAAMDFRPWVR